jgi:NADH:ubiquinone oxidoreductase subunit 3 (subunit A)
MLIYFNVVFFLSFYIFLSILITILLFFLSFRLVFQQPNLEKTSSYECGFLPFDDARSRFEIRFYVVAILFVIFDLEISFIFPWAISASNLGLIGLLFFYFFIIILTIGFLLEWYRGLLDF